MSSLTSITCIGFVLFVLVQGQIDLDLGLGNGKPGRSGLRFGFYKNKCNGEDVEAIVQGVVKTFMNKDPTYAPGLLRLMFHDCFLRGCDASVLIASTPTNRAEVEGGANRNLRGLDLIDAAKAELESKCPGVVSCADILALATRDAVKMVDSEIDWTVKTGRKDGRISKVEEVSQNIPSPFAHFSQLMEIFRSKGFSVEHLYVLSGAHTIGRSHCGGFSSRLYNHTGLGDTDPSLDPAYAVHLKSLCLPNDRSTVVDMDPDTPDKFDTNYYSLLKQNKGLFISDASLMVPRFGNYFANLLSNRGQFLWRFERAMEKLVELEVLTGSSGEIRKTCQAIN